MALSYIRVSFALLFVRSYRSESRAAKGSEPDGGDLHLYSALSRADEYGVERARALVDKRAEPLFHTHRAASAVHVARERLQLFLLYHGDGLDVRRTRRGFEIQLAAYGHNEHEMFALARLRDQRLEHALARLAQRIRHLAAVRYLRVVFVRHVMHFFRVQQSHRIGLYHYRSPRPASDPLSPTSGTI